MQERPNDEVSEVSVVEAHRELDRLLGEQRHFGFLNWLADFFLEPRNPFQAQVRKPKKSVVAVTGLGLMAFAIVWFFHFR